ncbi:hypothetical protein [Aureimonas sp. Leaf454]|uniref:hypothetical protein n=1 Tax=Aureimonas sp. Leaf454 TaxID=1736381 RepID=UPI0012E3F565|nr:hypothetical protein [Aureimonas sp. Leaf454]
MRLAIHPTPIGAASANAGVEIGAPMPRRIAVLRLRSIAVERVQEVELSRSLRLHLPILALETPPCPPRSFPSAPNLFPQAPE